MTFSLSRIRVRYRIPYEHPVVAAVYALRRVDYPFHGVPARTVISASPEESVLFTTCTPPEISAPLSPAELPPYAAEFRAARTLTGSSPARTWTA